MQQLWYFLTNNIKGLILIFNQPIDKFDSYNAAARRQASLPGGKPACGRFPRLVLFYLSALPIERLKISIKAVNSAKKFAKSIGFLSEMCYNGKANYSITINFKGDTNYGE